MALSDLTVYSEFAYNTMTEIVAQEVEKFNAASRGTIQLIPGALLGDYGDRVFWKKISGLVRRRNAYGTGAVTAKKLQNLVDTMVKVAGAAGPVEINPGQFNWIQKNPEEAGVVLGKQLAPDMLADMLNAGVLATYAALIQTSAMLTDVTADSPGTLSHVYLNNAAAKFGDRSGDIAAWITHSTPYHKLITNNLTNAQMLFNFGSVVVSSDAVGRPFIVTDTPSLINGSSKYHLLGLVQGALTVEQNNDYMDNVQTTNGDENIQRTWQAEWSYNVDVKGYSWDKTNGGKSPNDAAIGTSTNWDKYATNDKDGPGVVLRVNP